MAPAAGSKSQPGSSSTRPGYSKEQLSKAYDKFRYAEDLPEVLEKFQALCSLLGLKSGQFPLFFNQLRQAFSGHRMAYSMMDRLHEQAAKRGYVDSPAELIKRESKGRDSLDAFYDDNLCVTEDKEGSCAKRRVLIVGAGPVGLRMAIEAQMMGATVKVIESRQRYTRFNIAHVWKFAEEDLAGLEARHFYNMFCSGDINTISIRQLQLLLTKIALVLGVTIHKGVKFESLIPPSVPGEGWRAKVSSTNTCDISEYEFDVISDASKHMNTVHDGFKKEEQKQISGNYIAIAANFVYNRNNVNENEYKEIPGVVARSAKNIIKKLPDRGFDVENLVYYRRETHYFIMTIKKSFLRDYNLVKADYDAPYSRSLAPDNIHRKNLESFIIKVANIVTNDSMDDCYKGGIETCHPQLRTFHKNKNGDNDADLFKFEAHTRATCSSQILERKGRKLLIFLVGDGLMLPFWPLGLGIAKGFLSALDACWTMKIWSQNENRITPLELLYKQETFYRRLKEIITPNQIKMIKNMESEATCRCDPWRRYTIEETPRLKTCVRSSKLYSQYDTDIDIKGEDMETVQLYNEDKPFIASVVYGKVALLRWYCDLLHGFDDVRIVSLSTSWNNGRALWATLSICKEDYIDWSLYRSDDFAKNNQRAINIITLKFGIRPVMSGSDMANVTVKDEPKMFVYLDKLKDSLLINYKQEIEYALSQQSPEKRLELQSHVIDTDKLQSTLNESEDDDASQQWSDSEGPTLGDHNPIDEGMSPDASECSPLTPTTNGGGDYLSNGRSWSVSPEVTSSTPTAEHVAPSKLLLVFGSTGALSQPSPTLLKPPMPPPKVKANSTKKKRKSISFKVATKQPEGDLRVNATFTEREVRMNELKQMAASGFAGKKIGSQWPAARLVYPRVDSMPNIRVHGTSGDYCAACRLLIHTAGRMLSAQGLPVHSRCLRCAQCDRPCRGATYSYDKASCRFYCAEHSATDGEAAPISCESELDSDCDYVAETPKAKINPTARRFYQSSDEDATRSDQSQESDYKIRAFKWLKAAKQSLEAANSKDDMLKAFAKSILKDPRMAAILREELGAGSAPGSEASYNGDRRSGSLVSGTSVSIVVSSPESVDQFNRRSASQVEVVDTQKPVAATSYLSTTSLLSTSKTDVNDWKLKRGENTTFKSVAEMRESYSMDRLPTASPLERSGTMPHAIKSTCHYCKLKVFLFEGTSLNGKLVHRRCHKCEFCGVLLTVTTSNYNKTTDRFLCYHHKSSSFPSLQRAGTTPSNKAINTSTPPLETPKPKKKTLTRKITKFFTGKYQSSSSSQSKTPQGKTSDV